MEEIYSGVFKLLPSKVTPSKYVSFFVKRDGGNVLFPCFSSSSTIDSSFDWLAAQGGLRRQLLGDSHFKTPHCDEVAERFDAPLYCSEPEAPDVTRRLKHVKTFPLERHLFEPGLEAIPTPGHRPGGVCYLVTLEDRRYLFAGDAVWHDGEGWTAYPTKAGQRQMLESLALLRDLEFDVLLANTKISNPTCSIEFDAPARREFFDEILTRLS